MNKNILYYVYAMSPEKRAEAKVFTRAEANKLDRSTLLCGGTFHFNRYGLLYCLPEDYTYWEAWANEHGGKPIQWEDGILRAPNGKVIYQSACLPVGELESRVMRLQAELDKAVREANKRAFLLRKIEFYTNPKNRVVGEVAEHTLNLIHEIIVRATASTSAPESEATDGA